jgi:hypothetical protein
MNLKKKSQKLKQNHYLLKFLQMTLKRWNDKPWKLRRGEITSIQKSLLQIPRGKAAFLLLKNLLKAELN